MCSSTADPALQVPVNVSVRRAALFGAGALSAGAGGPVFFFANGKGF